MRSGGVRAQFVAVAAVVLGAFVAPAQASALDFTWTGAGGSPAWSDAGNWSGASAPSGSVGTLTFPAVNTCSDCASTAYGSEDDVAGLSANALSIDDSASYNIYGPQSLTLGAGGVTAAPTAHAGDSAVLLSSVVLGVPQTWTIAGDGAGARAGVFLGGDITGASYPLTVDLSNGAQLGMQHVETGALTIAGSGVLTSFAPSLNATDGNPVDVSSGASLVASGDGAVGALQLSGGAISLLGGVGFPPISAGKLSVNGGLGLDATSSVSMQIGYSGLGSLGHSIDDVPEITATGPVDLGNASLTLVPEDSCPIFSPGRTYTLVMTGGSLTGVFAGVPDGTAVTLSSSCPGSTQTMRINYTANSVIATVVNPGPSPTNIGVTTDPAAAVTNQPVTLTAAVTADYGTPAGTVGFADNGVPIAGCGSRPVVAQGSSGTATCKTSFTAAAGSCCSGYHYLIVTYAPSDSSTRGSSNTFDTLVFGSIAVGPAATTTTVTASSPSIVTGRRVTYTATVAPEYVGSTAPSGSIEFEDRGVAISACAKRPLKAVRGTATTACTVTYPTTGTHAVTARYAGDGNFSGSTSGPTRVTSWSALALRRQLTPSGREATIGELLRRRHLTQRIGTTTGGTLTIRWYGTTVLRNHRHRTLLATARTTYTAARKKTVTVTLTSAGRAILRHARRPRIAGTATFTATGARPVTVTFTFVLQR
jgi:hypothetical protein